MTIVISERMESRRDISEGKSRRSLELTYDIYDDDGIAITPQDARGLLPQQGDEIDTSIVLFARMHVRSVDIGRVPGNPGRCMARVVYVELSFWKSIDDIGFKSMDTDSVVVGRSVWRTNLDTNSFPTNGDVSGPALHADILGDRVDVHGSPTSIAFDLSAVELSVVLERPPDEAAIRVTKGHRNEIMFLGAEIGSMLLVEVFSSQIRCGVWRHTYRFAYDEFLHMVQIPLEDFIGVVLDAPPAGSEIPYMTARDVYWRQPFPGVVDFKANLPDLPTDGAGEFEQDCMPDHPPDIPDPGDIT